MNKGNIKSRHYQINLIAERCKGCGYCIEFCPKHLLRRSDDINNKGYHLVIMDSSNNCTGCDICSMICPDFAISVVPIGETPRKESV